MALRQTDREQIHQFAIRGAAIFDQVEQLMNQLVQFGAELPYRGGNAMMVKTRLVQECLSMAHGVFDSMRHIDTVIVEASSYIAYSLGGSPISLEPPTTPVQMPLFSVDTTVESASAGPLIEMVRTVRHTVDEVVELLSDLQSSFVELGAEGWIGPEYDDSLSQVLNVTSSAIDDMITSGAEINRIMRAQTEALGME